MASKNESTKPKKHTKSPETYNFSRVLLAIVEGFFGLINSGKIYTAIILAIFILLGIFAFNEPSSTIDLVSLLLLELFASSVPLLIFLLVGSNLVWVYLLKYFMKLHQEEINRLSEYKREAIHAPRNIETHTSSESSKGVSIAMPDTKK